MAAETKPETQLETFYVTFGQQWRRNPHPFGGHPDAVFSLRARDLIEAIRICEFVFPNKYSDVKEWNNEIIEIFYPLGEIACVIRPALYR